MTSRICAGGVKKQGQKAHFFVNFCNFLPIFANFYDFLPIFSHSSQKTCAFGAKTCAFDAKNLEKLAHLIRKLARLIRRFAKFQADFPGYFLQNLPRPSKIKGQKSKRQNLLTFQIRPCYVW